MKRILLAIFVATALSILVWIRADGFAISKIQGSLMEGNAQILNESNRSILSQPFHYLAKGRQCFVFESEDKQTVIKFLNYSRFGFPSLLMSIPLPHYWRMWLLAKEDLRRIRFEATLKSLQIAQNNLADETGLVYLHLQKGGDLPSLHLSDRAHRRYSIDLNSIAFILQKKATPIFNELEMLWQTQGAKGLQEGISQFVGFLKKRCDRLIADDDRDVGINYGFYDGRIMLIDPGRLFFDPRLSDSTRKQAELGIASKRLRRWLEKHHPESIAWLDQNLNDVSESAPRTNESQV